MENNTAFATYPSLADRVIVVTGGATGMGEAIVNAFAAQHAKVVVLDIQDAAAEHLLRRLESSGYPAPGYHNIRVNCVSPGAILTERQKQLLFTPVTPGQLKSRDRSNLSEERTQQKPFSYY
jgi:NAD(P)-dependent dehydrogenase (short-subunit alcohol dehydrogenase family)